MPNYYRSGWSEAGQAAKGLGDSLQDIAVDLSRQRYMREVQHETLIQRALENQQLNKYRNTQLEQQKQYQAAQIAESAAQGQFHKQRTAQMQEQSDTGQVLGDIMQYISENPDMSPEDMSAYQGAAVNRGARLGAQNPANIMEQIAQGIAMRDPNMRNIMAAGGVGNLYQNVGRGAVGASPIPGMQTIQGPEVLGAGDTGFGPQFGNPGGLRPPQAYGMPQTSPGRDLPSTDLDRLARIYSASMPGGTPPEPGDPTYPQFQAVTNAMARNQVMQGRPEVAPMAPQPRVEFQPPAPAYDDSVPFVVPPINYGTPMPREEAGDIPTQQLPAFDPSAAFQVPQPYMSTDSLPGQPKAVTKSTAAAKAARANDIEREQPTLTREQIIELVNREFNQR